MKKGWIEDDRATTWENKKFKKLVEDFCTTSCLEKHDTTKIKLQKMQEQTKRLSDFIDEEGITT